MVDYDALNAEGKFHTILEHAEKELHTFNGRYWQIFSLWRLGQVDKALNLSLSYLSDDFTQNEEEKVKLIYRIAVLYWTKGQYETAQQHLQAVLDILGEETDNILYPHSLNVLGLINFQSDLCIPYFEEALKKYKQKNDNPRIGATMVNLAGYYYNTGKLSKALQYYQEAYDLLNVTGNEPALANPLKGIGLVYKEMGDLDKALEFYNTSIDFYMKAGSTTDIAAIHGNIAEIFVNKGNFRKALKYHLQGLDYLDQTESKMDMIICLSLLVETYLLNDDVESAKKYYDRLQSIDIETDDDRIPFYKDFARGLMLKSSKRIIDIAKAQEIFRHLILIGQGPIVYDVRKIYIELLLAEYKTYQESEVLEEVIAQTDEMQLIAMEQKTYPAVIDARILKSKVAMINLNFDLADQMLEDALELAEQRDMQVYIGIINDEIDKLQETLQELRQIVEDSSVLDRMEENQLVDYIKNMRRMRK